MKLTNITSWISQCIDFLYIKVEWQVIGGKYSFLKIRSLLICHRYRTYITSTMEIIEYYETQGLVRKISALPGPEQVRQYVNTVLVSFPNYHLVYLIFPKTSWLSTQIVMKHVMTCVVILDSNLDESLGMRLCLQR